MMHFSSQTWKAEIHTLGSKRYVISKFIRYVRPYIHAMTCARSAELSFREKSGLIERYVRYLPSTLNHSLYTTQVGRYSPTNSYESRGG